MKLEVGTVQCFDDMGSHRRCLNNLYNIHFIDKSYVANRPLSLVLSRDLIGSLMLRLLFWGAVQSASIDADYVYFMTEAGLIDGRVEVS